MTMSMDLTASFVLLAVAALAAGFALRTLRRRPRAAGRVRLYEMMRLRGVPSPRPRDQAAAHDIAAAERRCAACASKKLCDELLRSGDSKGYRQFCPNALYLEWLHSNSLNFD
jgi:hypothetical protein